MGPYSQAQPPERSFDLGLQRPHQHRDPRFSFQGRRLGAFQQPCFVGSLYVYIYMYLYMYMYFFYIACTVLYTIHHRHCVYVLFGPLQATRSFVPEGGEGRHHAAQLGWIWELSPQREAPVGMCRIPIVSLRGDKISWRESDDWGLKPIPHMV